MGCAFPEHHSGGGGHVPVKAVATVLAAAAVAGTARAVHPHLVVPWALLAMCATLAGCAVLAWCGARFARWEQRRAEPEVLRYRTGERIREVRR